MTVVCTYYKNPQGLELKPFVLMWTHDLHILPTFLRANDMPRYLKHLIRSRGATEVIISQSALAYELLPVLTEQLPEVRFIDVSFFFFPSFSQSLRKKDTHFDHLTPLVSP